MKQQETIAGRIVRNVNKVLEVIPRTLNSDADVIKLNFQKARKTKRSSTARKSKSTSKTPLGLRVKARAKTVARKASTMAATAKRKVSNATVARKRKPAKNVRKRSTVHTKSVKKSKTTQRPIARAA
jgi:hypothetical protein